MCALAGVQTQLLKRMNEGEVIHPERVKDAIQAKLR